MIFDSGGQRIYWREALKDRLNLKPIRSELILIKRFATEEGVLKEIDVVQICVKYKTKSTEYQHRGIKYFIFIFVYPRTKYSNLRYFKI